MKKTLLILHFIFLYFSASAYSVESYQVRLDFGLDRYISRVNESITSHRPPYSSVKTGEYFAIAVHKTVSSLSSIGSRIDIQTFNDHTLLSVRAIDYQLALSESFKANIYLGAARYQFRTPAYGYSAGLGLLYHPSSWGNWGLQLEARYFDALARDKLTEEDSSSLNSTPDSFYSFQSLSFGVNYYF
jgi:opacity protein-like surface antigen